MHVLQNQGEAWKAAALFVEEISFMHVRQGLIALVKASRAARALYCSSPCTCACEGLKSCGHVSKTALWLVIAVRVYERALRL